MRACEEKVRTGTGDEQVKRLLGGYLEFEFASLAGRPRIRMYAE